MADERENGHTPGPWKVVPIARVYTDDGPIAESISVAAPHKERQANARRIVAAVNACEGIPTEALEDGVVRELVGLVREASDHSREYDDPAAAALDFITRARAAIAKAEGADR